MSCPLPSKVQLVEHISQADFRRSSVGYRECLDAFTAPADLIGGRDLIEEFVCANVWPLSDGWLEGSLAKVRVRDRKETLPFPKFSLLKPPEESNEAIVAEVERRGSELAGPYLSKEYDSFVVCCSGGIRVNRSLAVMGVKYPNCEEPKKPEKRNKGASGEDPVAKKRKPSSDVVESSKVNPKV